MVSLNNYRSFAGGVAPVLLRTAPKESFVCVPMVFKLFPPLTAFLKGSRGSFGFRFGFLLTVYGRSDFAQLIADYKVKTEEAAAAAAAAAGSGGDAGRAQQQTACAIAVSKGRSDLAQLIADYRATEQGVSPSYGWLFHRQNHGL